MQINSQGWSLIFSIGTIVLVFNLIMTRGQWLINYDRSEVRIFTENRENYDQFN